MSTSSSDNQAAGPAPGHSARRPVRKAKKKTPAGHSSLGKEASATANRRAAAILEVLAGERTPSQAASVLGISVNHYYLLERKALAGLLAACEPQPKGPPGPSPEKQLAELERELSKCRRECLRQAALVRTTQRAIGLPTTQMAKTKASSQVASKAKADQAGKAASTKRKRRRRPTVRALRAAETLRENSSGEIPPPALEQAAPEGSASQAADAHTAAATPITDDVQGTAR